ncbi:hypothetical protein BDR05DRAFT_673116 [Suillus weaverae]|nr:hypothetical protein BDR05DRAFT_673116 [Suillus weaverae]
MLCHARQHFSCQCNLELDIVHCSYPRAVIKSFIMHSTNGVAPVLRLSKRSFLQPYVVSYGLEKSSISPLTHKIPLTGAI